ncbi:UNVERIFIED_CONTAM: protein MAINTENANCE OF PSII UNDER HIGH LIGHT 1 [Sesamum angustifolium]|uniref:Protein MAINTENANCE OF PSII UNDER HIGH LIGHT 1 n=1 Tax=Sesamum angustifolium TaxID=2727405 RepID=A0AAW2RI80_9LAMI
MACALYGNSCAISAPANSTRSLLFNKSQPKRRQSVHYCCVRVRAASEDADDCNTEECAPDKEVGKVSVEWLAGEKTRVVGTFPPRNRGWTGYVEKDTAGQTNIYSVEPAVYIAESAISSGTAGGQEPTRGADRDTQGLLSATTSISLRQWKLLKLLHPLLKAQQLCKQKPQPRKSLSLRFRWNLSRKRRHQTPLSLRLLLIPLVFVISFFPIFVYTLA